MNKERKEIKEKRTVMNEYRKIWTKKKRDKRRIISVNDIESYLWSWTLLVISSSSFSNVVCLCCRLLRTSCLIFFVWSHSTTKLPVTFFVFFDLIFSEIFFMLLVHFTLKISLLLFFLLPVLLWRFFVGFFNTQVDFNVIYLQMSSVTLCDLTLCDHFNFCDLMLFLLLFLLILLLYSLFACFSLCTNLLVKFSFFCDISRCYTLAFCCASERFCRNVCRCR